MFRILLAIGLGSFLGGVSRYLLSRFVDTNIAGSFPFATMIVNVLGCFIMGVLYALFDKNYILNNELRMFLTIGFCGSFTTFSTFANEGLKLLREEHFLLFILYAFGSLFVGCLAVYLGYILCKLLR